MRTLTEEGVKELSHFDLLIEIEVACFGEGHHNCMLSFCRPSRERYHRQRLKVHQNNRRIAVLEVTERLEKENN